MSNADQMPVDRVAYDRATEILSAQLLPADEAVILSLVIRAHERGVPLSAWHHEQWREISAKYT